MADDDLYGDLDTSADMLRAKSVSILFGGLESLLDLYDSQTLLLCGAC